MSLPVISIDRDRAYPPRVTEFTKPFWQALRQGDFNATHCNSCGKFSFPPRTFCRHCWSRDTTWFRLSGKGVLYSHTRIHALPALFANEPAPLHVGIVDLVEGLRVAMPIWGDAGTLDGPVEMIVLSYRDGPLFAARAVET